MLEQAESNRQAIGIEEKIIVGLADCGYGSQENFAKTAAGDIELFVATQKDHKQRKAMKEQGNRMKFLTLFFDTENQVYGLIQNGTI